MSDPHSFAIELVGFGDSGEVRLTMRIAKVAISRRRRRKVS
jgi:hypothetical protein